MGGEGGLTGVKSQEVIDVCILPCGRAATASSHAQGYTWGGATGVMYPADPILKTGTNMSYRIYNHNQKSSVNQIRCMQHTIYELMAC